MPRIPYTNHPSKETFLPIPSPTTLTSTIPHTEPLLHQPCLKPGTTYHTSFTVNTPPLNIPTYQPSTIPHTIIPHANILSHPINQISSIYFSYAEYVVVKDIANLVKIPDTISLEVAAMLPTGALTALNTIMRTRPLLYDKAKRKPSE